MIEISTPLRTERLALRPFTPADEHAMLRFEAHSEVARYLYNEPRTPSENAEELARRTRLTALRKEGDTLVLAIELDGTAIGYVLLTWLSQRHRQGEFGYVLHPDFHGEGYATEAAAAILRLGFEQLGLHRVIGRCDPRNEPSVRLMERLGMRREAHLRESEIFKGEWGDELHYALLDREWHASPWATVGVRPQRSEAGSAPMPHIHHLNPPESHPTPGYHHVTLVQPGPTAYLAGQCPLDRAGELVGPGSYSDQTDQVIANSLLALDSVGADPRHVVRSVIYVQSTEKDVLADVWRRLNDSPLGPAFASASTLLGVAQLGYPGQLVELDLTASLPAGSPSAGL